MGTGKPTTGAEVRRRVAIVVKSEVDSPEAVYVARELRRLGFEASIVVDGDRAALQADAIVASGYCGTLSGLVRLIRATPAAERPIVTALLHEPLLPQDVPRWTMSLGARFTSTGLGFDGGNKTLLRLVRPIFSVLACFGLGRYSPGNTGKEIQFVFEQSAWVRAGISEGWLAGVGASTLQKCDVVRNWGARAVFVPHTLQFDGSSVAPDTHPKDIDVLFLGRMSNLKRALALKAIVSDLRSRGLRVELRYHGVRGEERTRLLRRTRVILHLPKYPWDTAWIRWYLGAENGVAIVAQTSPRPEPFRPGIDYEEGPVTDLADIAYQLATDEARRARLVNACRERIVSRMDYSKAMTGFVESFLRDDKTGTRPCPKNGASDDVHQHRTA